MMENAAIGSGSQIERQSDRMEGNMGEHAWQVQYEAATQAPDFLECIAAAKQEIYDRLEDHLQQRQQIDAAEWRAIKKALCFLDDAQRHHDIAA